MKIKEIQISKNNLKKLLRFEFVKSIWDYLFRKSGTIAMIIFLLVAMISGFVIYKYLYSSIWKDGEKNNYLIKAKQTRANFKIDDFNNVIKNIKDRESRYKKTEPVNVEDIFRL